MSCLDSISVYHAEQSFIKLRSERGNGARCISIVLLGRTKEITMMNLTKASMAALAAVTIAGSTLAVTTSADARWGGRGGYYRGGGFGLGAGIATGLALGAVGSAYYGGYGYPA